MKRMPAGGYTILEVLIFLVISAALLTSAMATVNGKAERTRFAQSTRGFEQDLKDILNDVSTGFYPTNNNIVCNTLPGGNLDIHARTGTENGEQGTQNCIFLGKAIEIAEGSGQYTAFTIAGSKYQDRQPVDLADAHPRLLGYQFYAPPTPGISETDQIGANMIISKIVSRTNPGNTVRGIAIISEFSKKSTVDASLSGNAARVNVFEVVRNFSDASAFTTSLEPATNGILLCLRQEGLIGDRRGHIVIGGNGSQVSTSSVVDSWPDTGECDGGV